jgi:hypothetical protein
MALSVISLAAKKWSLLGHSGHWPRRTLTELVANDPSATFDAKDTGAIISVASSRSRANCLD